MTKSKKKRTQLSAEPELKVKGILAMTVDILPWELDLLGPILGAIKDVGHRRIYSKTGEKDDGR
jgi:hypothetical protein